MLRVIYALVKTVGRWLPLCDNTRVKMAYEDGQPLNNRVQEDCVIALILRDKI